MTFSYPKRSLRVALAVLGVTLTSSAFALDFNVTYGNDGSTGDFTADQKATIDHALAEIKGFYNDNVLVKLQILNSKFGLGGSSTWLFETGYAGYRNALTADATSALDAQAVASLPVGNPFPNRTVLTTTALGRALGFAMGGTPDGFDSTITLNAAICFTRSQGPLANLYDLHATAQHEIDEAMGFGGPTSLFANFSNAVGAGDLFRYRGAGLRTDLALNSVGNYLSFDGGVTKIRDFNNGGFGGDYADWASDGQGFVQNAFGIPGIQIEYSAKELAFGDGVGWDLKPVPEPASMMVLGLGALGLIRRKKA